MHQHGILATKGEYWGTSVSDIPMHFAGDDIERGSFADLAWCGRLSSGGKITFKNYQNLGKLRYKKLHTN